jgi:hypothetical protein
LEDALCQHTVGGGPPVQLGADDEVVGAAPDDFLALNLVFWDAFLDNVGDKVEAPVVFGIRQEDICDNPIRDNFVLSPKPLHLVIKR